jgi:hypothetical protein
MSVSRPDPAFIAAALIIVFLASARPAMADHGHFRTGRGPEGQGYASGRSVSRSSGSATVDRGVQTSGGHGVENTRTTTHGDGTLNNTATRTYDNGQTTTHTGSATRNDDGSVTVNRAMSSSSGASATQTTTYSRGD